MVGSSKKTLFIFNNFIIFISFNSKSWGLNLDELQLLFILVWKSKLANQTNCLLLSSLVWNCWSCRSLLVTWSVGLLTGYLAASQYLRTGFATNTNGHKCDLYHKIKYYASKCLNKDNVVRKYPCQSENIMWLGGLAQFIWREANTSSEGFKLL